MHSSSSGIAILKRIADKMVVEAVVEQEPKMEGRRMFMILAPNKATTGQEVTKK